MTCIVLGHNHIGGSWLARPPPPRQQTVFAKSCWRTKDGWRAGGRIWDGGHHRCLRPGLWWTTPLRTVETTRYSYGLYSYGLYSYGLYSYGVYSYYLYSYGLCSYGCVLQRRPGTVMVYIVMVLTAIAYTVMAYVVMAAYCKDDPVQLWLLRLWSI